MITENKIKTLAEEHLKGTDRFLVAVKVSTDNRIKLFIDADSSVTIDHCVALSRHIESNLDREKEDFELKVMSAGADQPFSLLRQYKKNIGRKIDVLTTGDKQIRGKLLKADNNEITVLEEKSVVKGKSKKIITGDEITLPMQEVKQAKVVITF